MDLDSPAAPHSGQPRLTLAVNGWPLLSWLESEPGGRFTLKFARLTSDTSWSTAWTVFEGTDGFVNWTDVPALSEDPGRHLLAGWLQRLGEYAHGYGIRFATIGPDADGWSAPRWLHEDTSSTEHGFVSLLQEPEGGFRAVWLDGRETPAGGSMTLRTAVVQADGRITDRVLLDDRVCDCCPTAMVRAGDGSIVVAYRDRSDQEVRDIALVHYADGAWSTPHPLSRDGWMIAGCPVNGPALAAEDSLVAAAWFTMSGGQQPSVFVARSSNFGKSFGPPTRVDRGSPEGRVDLAMLQDRSVLVSWLETPDSLSADTSASLWVRVLAPDGTWRDSLRVTDLPVGRRSGIPRVISHPQGGLIVWTEAGESPRVRTAVLHRVH